MERSTICAGWSTFRECSEGRYRREEASNEPKENVPKPYDCFPGGVAFPDACETRSTSLPRTLAHVKRFYHDSHTRLSRICATEWRLHHN